MVTVVVGVVSLHASKMPSSYPRMALLTCSTFSSQLSLSFKKPSMVHCNEPVTELRENSSIAWFRSSFVLDKQSSEYNTLCPLTIRHSTTGLGVVDVQAPIILFR